MKPRDKIEQFVAETRIGTSDTRDRQVLSEVLQAHEGFKHRKSQPQSQPYIWRTIMSSNTRKLAAAAGVILAVALLITMSDWMARPAWALEQTIEALKDIKAIYIAGRVQYPGRPNDAEFEIWAKSSAGDPGISGDFRLREGDTHLCIASEQENLTYVCGQYDSPTVNIVYITEGLNRRGPTFPSGDMIAELKNTAQDWKEEYRKDPRTGKSCVYVTFTGHAVNTARYWEIQIDLETKLPVRAAVWFDEQRQGKPHYEYTNLQYNLTMPEDFFKFSIPAGAQVVDCRILRKQLQESPDCGVSVEGLSFGEACKKTVQAYWQAVIKQDWTAAENLRPLAAGGLKDIYAGNPPVELVAVPKMNHLSDPGTFAEVFCTVKLKDGSTQQSLLNVDLYTTPQGRFGVIAGSVGPELYSGN
jgi:hypothetical protein